MIRAPQDFAAGLFMIAIAAIALWQGAGLAAGTLGHMGPGMLPRALGVIALLLGVALVADACMEKGASLDRWQMRGPLFILGAAVLFGLAIRPAGLALAGPLAVIVGAQADRGARLAESAIFAVVLTAFCIGLFKLALGLPIPVAPWLLGY